MKKEGRLPDFLIIGAMKCGTTSLHEYLGKHPDIFVSKQKEIHYFADNNFKRYPIDWYKSHFLSSKRIVGTSPQNYTKRDNKYYQNIPLRIKKIIPNVKLIYIVRDPIERYKSHISENFFGEPEHDRIYNMETEQYFKTGLYYHQLELYLRYFELDQILVLTLEELIEDKLITLNRVFKFLGVDEMKDDKLFNFKSNDKESKDIPDRLKKTLVYRITNKISNKLAIQICKSFIMKPYWPSIIPKSYQNNYKLSLLKKSYKEDVKKLETLVNVSFDKWKL